MPTLGEELRQRREQRGISLAEISETTRIGTRFLKAIETDNFSILPGGIFTRSFIRAFAKHVGMNEDEALSLYLQQLSGTPAEHTETSSGEPAQRQSVEAPPAKRTPTPPKVTTQKASPPEDRSRRFEPVTFRQSPSRTSWPTIVIGSGIVIFVVIIVIALVKQLNQATNESASQSAAVAQRNAPAPTAPAQTPPAQPSQPSSTPPDSTTQQASVPAGQPMVVKLEAATGDVWIKYQVDDAKPTTIVLKQGQSQDLPPAQTHVTLNYGNRLTLKLKINNRDANFPADTPKFASQVVISRDNIQTYLQ
jgi:cytoskeleton protein RodZ